MSKTYDDDMIQVVEDKQGNPIDITPGTAVIKEDGSMYCIQKGEGINIDIDNHPVDSNGKPVTVVNPEPQTFRDDNGNEFTALVFNDREGNLRQVVKDKVSDCYFVVTPDMKLAQENGELISTENKIIRVNEDNIPIDAQGQEMGVYFPDNMVQVVADKDGNEINLNPGSVVIDRFGGIRCIQEGDTLTTDKNLHPVDDEGYPLTVVTPEARVFQDENGKDFTALVFNDNDGNLRQVAKDISNQWYYVINPKTEMLYADGHTGIVDNQVIRVDESNIPVDAEGKTIVMFEPMENADGERIDELATAMKRDNQAHFGLLRSKSALLRLYEQEMGGHSEPTPRTGQTERSDSTHVMPVVDRDR